MTEEKKELEKNSPAPESNDKEENLEKNEDDSQENVEVSEQSEETPPASEDDGNEEQGDSEPESQEEIDYKAELEKARKQLGKAEHTIVETKKENKQLKKQVEEDDWDTDEPDVNKVKEELTTEFTNKFNEFKNSFVGDTVDEEIDLITKNPDEKELIKFYYENKLVQTGHSRKAIKEDIEIAKAMANRQRIDRENRELKNTVINKSSMSKDGVSSSVKRNYSEPDAKLTPAEKSLVDRINNSRLERGLKALKAKDIISGKTK